MKPKIHVVKIAGVPLAGRTKLRLAVCTALVLAATANAPAIAMMASEDLVNYDGRGAGSASPTH